MRRDSALELRVGRVLRRPVRSKAPTPSVTRQDCGGAAGQRRAAVPSGGPPGAPARLAARLGLPLTVVETGTARLEHAIKLSCQ